MAQSTYAHSRNRKYKYNLTPEMWAYAGGKMICKCLLVKPPHKIRAQHNIT